MEGPQPSLVEVTVSRKSDTIFGRRTIPEPSTPHIGKGVALDAETVALVYMYARIPQVARIYTSFYATDSMRCPRSTWTRAALEVAAALARWPRLIRRHVSGSG